MVPYPIVLIHYGYAIVSNIACAANADFLPE